ncbi:PH domain containing protein [Histomonas meleagridis]|uniref:PH domain containing protein n=1 Tax=Histomonas meleagridis TaxID=135588 RepID=UPI003559A095|nr:PH domain containing protein [Histomonas meleagridis]KAH0805688.1 PH domain containing protein [Histomonas meleagridis]
MSIAKLLGTTNLKTLTRSLKLYNSYFVSNMDEVFDHFSDYLPFYMFVLNNRSSLSIAYSDLSERLVQAVIKYGPNINPNAINPILTYFFYCFDASNIGFKADSFVAHTFEPSDAVPAITSIFSKVSPQNYLEPLLKLLASSKSTEILNILEKYQTDLIPLIIKKSDELINTCIQCLLSLVKGIVSFITRILNEVVTVEPNLIEHLLPYSGYMQAKIPQCQELKTLNTHLLDYLYKQKLPPPPPENMSAPLTRILLNQDAFGKQANVSEFNHVITAKPKKSAGNFNAMSLSKRLDKFNNTIPQASEPLRPSIVAAAPEPQLKEIIESTAFKLGGFQKNSWQSRFFQFYPNNHCLVWRSKKGAPEIKGLLLFDSSIKVEKSSKGLKGKTNVVTLTIGKKQRVIAYSSSDELDKWYNAFKSAVESKATN